jgi:hypothetical protein
MASRVRKIEQNIGDKLVPNYGPRRERRLWAKYGAQFEARVSRRKNAPKKGNDLAEFLEWGANDC